MYYLGVGGTFNQRLIQGLTLTTRHDTACLISRFSCDWKMVILVWKGLHLCFYGLPWKYYNSALKRSQILWVNSRFQSVTNIFEYSIIFVTNINLDIRLYWFFIQVCSDSRSYQNQTLECDKYLNIIFDIYLDICLYWFFDFIQIFICIVFLKQIYSNIRNQYECHTLVDFFAITMFPLWNIYFMIVASQIQYLHITNTISKYLHENTD